MAAIPLQPDMGEITPQQNGDHQPGTDTGKDIGNARQCEDEDAQFAHRCGDLSPDTKPAADIGNHQRLPDIEDSHRHRRHCADAEQRGRDRAGDHAGEDETRPGAHARGHHFRHQQGIGAPDERQTAFESRGQQSKRRDRKVKQAGKYRHFQGNMAKGGPRHVPIRVKRTMLIYIPMPPTISQRIDKNRPR